MGEKCYKYYLDDNDWVYAIDNEGKHYAFNAISRKLEERNACVDSYWGGCSEEYAKQRMTEILKKEGRLNK